jgi:flagellar basal body-associated protein FliL
VRSLILINSKLLTLYPNYTTPDVDFVAYTQSDITDALNSLYDLQNNISLSGLSLTYEH